MKRLVLHGKSFCVPCDTPTECTCSLDVPDLGVSYQSLISALDGLGIPCEGFAVEIEHDLEKASKISVHVLSHPQRSRRDFHQSNSQAIEGCTPSPDPNFLDVS